MIKFLLEHALPVDDKADEGRTYFPDTVEAWPPEAQRLLERSRVAESILKGAQTAAP
jgi:hypothetical protein